VNNPTAILLIGPTGSGKTPLGELIEARGLWHKTFRHFDFGRRLRDIDAGRTICPSLNREQLVTIRSCLRDGALLADKDFEIVRCLLGELLNSPAEELGDPVILNGFPRNVNQAKSIEQILTVRLLVHLDCTAKTALDRIRRNTGGDRTNRSDDHIEAVAARLALFARKTAPLIEHYRSEGTRIEHLAVSTETTSQRLWHELSERERPGDL